MLAGNQSGCAVGNPHAHDKKVGGKTKQIIISVKFGAYRTGPPAVGFYLQRAARVNKHLNGCPWSRIQSAAPEQRRHKHFKLICAPLTELKRKTVASNLRNGTGCCISWATNFFHYYPKFSTGIKMTRKSYLTWGFSPAAIERLCIHRLVRLRRASSRRGRKSRARS